MHSLLTPRLSRTTATAILLAMIQSPAMALTSEQAWTLIKEVTDSYGASINAARQDGSAGTLRLLDVTYRLDNATGSLTGTIPSIELVEQTGGDVRLTMSDGYDMLLNNVAPDGSVAEIVMKISQKDLAVTLGGTPQETTMAYSAPEISVSVASWKVNGTARPVQAQIMLSGYQGSYDVSRSAETRVDSTARADEVSLSFEASAPDDQGKLALRSTIEGVTAEWSGDLASLSRLSDPNAAPGATGAGTSVAFSHSGSDTRMSFDDPSQNAQASASSSAGSMRMELLPQSLSFGGTSKGLSLRLSGSDIPVPELTAALDEADYNIALPVMQSEEPQDFVLSASLLGLTVSEEMWRFIDPTKVIPRDPARLSVDLSGKARWLINIFDPASVSDPSQPAADLRSLDINGLTLAVGGAEMTGKGGFRFENDKPSPLGSGPKPVGTLDLTLTGGYALMDKLTQIGVLAQQQTMGARMMMGLFAKPGDGPDTLQSRIEITEDGALMANGQRLQ